MLVLSAKFPNKAEPSPPIPNAKPKNNPATKPTLPGMSSCAYTRIAENAEEIIIPIGTIKTPVQKKFE